MYHYIYLHYYHPWYKPIAVPIIPPPPVPPAAVTYRNYLPSFYTDSRY
ncbi:hypothetical protein [Neobacillus drentensis]